MFIYSTKQFWSLDFMKTNVKKILSFSTLPMIQTMVDWESFMNSKQWIDNNFFVASWNHNLMIGF